MDIPGLIGSVNASLTLAKLLVDERDRQKAAAIQVDLTNKLIQAQAQISEVLGSIIAKDERIGALTQRVRELEAIQTERDRYELSKIGSVESFAYKLREPADLKDRTAEPSHFLCQPCFDAGKKSVLTVGKYVAHCTLCKTNLSTNPKPPVNYNRGRTGGGWMSA